MHASSIAHILALFILLTESKLETNPIAISPNTIINKQHIHPDASLPVTPHNATVLPIYFATTYTFRSTISAVLPSDGANKETMPPGPFAYPSPNLEVAIWALGPVSFNKKSSYPNCFCSNREDPGGIR